MNGCDMLLEAKRRFIAELESRAKDGGGCCELNEEVIVSAPLTSREAIGNPGRDDFPILKGKEVLMQAVYRGTAGQAFTSASGSFQGSLEEVLSMPLDGSCSFERAVLVSTMNAVLGHLELVKGTVHCKDDGPKRCAACLKEWMEDPDANRVGLVGMQPALLEALVETLGPDRVMVSDLAEAGEVRCGVNVLDGSDSSSMFERCQIVLVTGSTIVNGTVDRLIENAKLHKRRVVFYGTTIAGAAHLLGLERWCPCSM
jgi:uncharacterized protein (DUF4213/DUF364 family)